MNRVKQIVCASLIGVTLLLAACDRPPPSSPPPLKQQNSNWPAKITIVQMPNENNPNAGEKHEGFRAGLEKALGIKVEELEGTEYTVGIEAMKAKNLDVLLVTPMSYYQAKRIANAEPFVTTAVTTGADPYKTVFIVKKDRSDINTLEDLRGTAFAFVDPASSSGYMYPKAHLVTQLGLNADQLEQPNYFFKTVVYSGKHDSSLIGVSMGDYEAAAVGYGTIRQMDEAGVIDREDIKIIGETEIIPNPCYVIRSDLPQSLKDAILDYYLAYDDPEYFEMFYRDPNIRYTRAYDSDYAVVEEMVRVLKIEE
jgi:phosphonate transport system substrate-binding protein